MQIRCLIAYIIYLCACFKHTVIGLFSYVCRVNQAMFTDVIACDSSGSSKDSIREPRVASISDDKNLFLHSLEGKQVTVSCVLP